MDIILPSVADMKQLLSGVEQKHQLQMEKYFLPQFLALCDEQENVIPEEGLVTRILTATNRALKDKYGEEKFMGTIEGWAFIGNQLPGYISKLVPNKKDVDRIIASIISGVAVFK